MPNSQTRPGAQVGFRISDEEQVDFIRVAELEGFDTIQKWVLHLAKKRAAAVNKAVRSGEFMEVDGKVILFQDLPRDIEIKKKDK